MERRSRPEQFDRPLFVVGSPRSGTTLFSRILDSHSRIAIYHESHYYPIFRPDLYRYGDLRSPRNLRRLIEDVREVTRVQGFMAPPSTEEFLEILDEPTFEGVFAALLRLYSKKHAKARCGDKTPGHHAYLSEILEKFDSPVIYILRDPRDVITSIQTAFHTSLDGSIRTWNQAFYDYKRFSRRVHLIRYEDLVSDPRQTIESACAYIGESFEAEMFNFFERIPQRLTTRPIFKKLTRQLDRDSLGRYRGLPQDALKRIEACCAEGMEALGYPFSQAMVTSVAMPPPSKLDFALDRLRYYGTDWKRWRRGWMRWKIMLRLRLRGLFSGAPLSASR
jgi:Sulfotransferase family